MAIPIRLTLANAKDQIDLVAQSIDMSINRNVSAFPTPNNFLQRFAVDTNVPSIKIDINGIFVDDEGLNTNGGSVNFDSRPMRSAINFGAILPTRKNSFQFTSHPFVGGSIISKDNWISVNDVFKSQSSTITIRAPVGASYEEASSDTEEINVRPFTQLKSSTNYATSASTITVSFLFSIPFITNIPADVIINTGDRLVKEDGSLIGTVQSVSGNNITFDANIATALATNDRIYYSLRAFNHIGESIGFVDYIIDDPAIADGDPAIFTMGLTAANDAEVLSGRRIFVNSQPSLESMFKFQTIKLIPSYWLENPPITGLLWDSSMAIGSNLDLVNTNTNTTSIPRAGVRLQFDVNSEWSGLSNFGVTVSGGTNPVKLRDAGLVRLGTSNNVADFDAVISVPIKSIGEADNPALAMATLVKEAFEISGNVVDAVTTGFNPSGDKTLASAFTVRQEGVLLLFEQNYTPNLSIQHPHLLSPGLTDLFTGVEYHSPNSTPTESRKSAGDKVQDLIGLVSNSNRNTDLLRGIQIPYDSLVQSSGVTGVARNFFLTFGEIETNLKGSEGNNRSANKPMQNLLLGMSDGGAGDESPDNWYDKFIEPIIPNEIEAVFGFLVGAGQQMWVTLTDQPARGNDGGMRIIPEKLHVRYDAGNNYYAFNLELMASDYVIGV